MLGSLFHFTILGFVYLCILEIQLGNDFKQQQLINQPKGHSAKNRGDQRGKPYAVSLSVTLLWRTSTHPPNWPWLAADNGVMAVCCQRKAGHCTIWPFNPTVRTYAQILSNACPGI